MKKAILTLCVLATFGCEDDPADPKPDLGESDMTSMDQSDDGPAMTDCEPIPSGFDSWEHQGSEARVDVALGSDCERTYTLTSNAPRRDNLPESPRRITENPNAAHLRTASPMFDALYALALEEVRELSVDQIRDGAFNNGDPVDCDGCFETGAKWNYVWTRDTAYAVDLALGAVEPQRSKNSLAFKTALRRDTGERQIVQDTGTGGSYPISTDRVSWALGARSVLYSLSEAERGEFEDLIWESLTNTIEHDREVVWDPTDGLYRGETSFLDWREQTYPGWTAQDTVQIGMSKSLSTNILHANALRLAAELAIQREEPDLATKYYEWAGLLDTAIINTFWNEDEGLFHAYTHNDLAPSSVATYDLLGLSLAILSDDFPGYFSTLILNNFPHYGAGAPVVAPQQQFTPIYHNRGEWPFVSSYWLLAAAKEKHAPVFDRMFNALVRGAAMNLSNMENFEAQTGLPWVDDGEYSGPVVNSQRQLWSVAGYLGMVNRGIFGIQTTELGIEFKPFISKDVADKLFGEEKSITLNNYPFRDKKINITLELPDTIDPLIEDSYNGFELGGLFLGNALLGGGILTYEGLEDGSDVLIILQAHNPDEAQTINVIDQENWRAVFKPRPPEIVSVNEDQTSLTLSFNASEELAEDISFTVYRDGVMVASEIEGDATTWVDPAFDPASDQTPCYTVSTTYKASGNESHPSKPVCWWGSEFERVRSFSAQEFEVTGGTPVTNHGRFHYEGWGSPDHTISVLEFSPNKTGKHLLQVVYGNGAGPINTGITCGVKRIDVIDTTTQEAVGAGYLVMPHLGDWGRWAESNFVAVQLNESNTYEIRISGEGRAQNMSILDHFDAYTGGLGGEQPFNDVNITELKILSL